MNIRKSRLPALAVLSAAVLTCGVQHAHALSMNTQVQTISQSGFSAGVNLGHTVIASTPMNRLYAAGGFVASCAAAHTGTISDQRGLPASTLIGGAQLVVTVPIWLPAVRDMPGFDQTPGGTTLFCTYNWTSEAEESAFTIGVGGISITIGGEKTRDGRSVPFEMYMPGSTEKSNGCIH